MKSWLASQFAKAFTRQFDCHGLFRFLFRRARFGNDFFCHNFNAASTMWAAAFDFLEVKASSCRMCVKNSVRLAGITLLDIVEVVLAKHSPVNPSLISLAWINVLTSACFFACCVSRGRRAPLRLSSRSMKLLG